MAEENPAFPAEAGYIGHWYRIKCEVTGMKVSMVGNLYWGKHYSYAVLVMFPAAPSDPSSATRFANSFSVIGDAAQ